MSDMMLKVDNINVYYGQIHTLKDVSIEVKKGEIVALIGANGAGKTTTLRTISGLLRSKTGRIEFNDEDISHTEAHKLVSKGIAHVPEGRHVFLQMTVQENLEMGAYTNASYTKEGIADVYQRFPRLKHRRNQIAGTLSGGEQQRLAIARALLNNPQVILADEPTGNLDPAAADGIMQLFASIVARGCAVLMSTHNISNIQQYPSRTLRFHQGKVTEIDLHSILGI